MDGVCLDQETLEFTRTAVVMKAADEADLEETSLEFISQSKETIFPCECVNSIALRSAL